VNSRVLSFLTYLGLVFSKWREMITGGVIALLLALLPFTGLPRVPFWVFWIVIALALAVASYRVWNNVETEAQQLRSDALRASSSEPPQFKLLTSWSDGIGPKEGRLHLFLRNTGRLPIRSLQFRPIGLGFIRVSFKELVDLQSDIDQEIVYTMSGLDPTSTTDLLDVLMIAWNSIDPIEYSLVADVVKHNNQSRTIKFNLSYVPLANPRRVTRANELDECISFTMEGSS
jgi:hypothetical protein